MSERDIINEGSAFGLSLTCHPEQSEGSHTDHVKHAHVLSVINYPAGGPSPSARLGMTAV
jgi:hypothetical protein